MSVLRYCQELVQVHTGPGAGSAHGSSLLPLVYLSSSHCLSCTWAPGPELSVGRAEMVVACGLERTGQRGQEGDVQEGKLWSAQVERNLRSTDYPWKHVGAKP